MAHNKKRKPFKIKHQPIIKKRKTWKSAIIALLLIVSISTLESHFFVSFWGYNVLKSHLHDVIIFTDDGNLAYKVSNPKLVEQIAEAASYRRNSYASDQFTPTGGKYQPVSRLVIELNDQTTYSGSLWVTGPNHEILIKSDRDHNYWRTDSDLPRLLNYAIKDPQTTWVYPFEQ